MTAVRVLLYTKNEIVIFIYLLIYFLQLAGGLLTGKHRYEDRDSDNIQHGRYAGTGEWADV